MFSRLNRDQQRLLGEEREDGMSINTYFQTPFNFWATIKEAANHGPPPGEVNGHAATVIRPIQNNSPSSFPKHLITYSLPPNTIYNTLLSSHIKLPPQSTLSVTPKFSVCTLTGWSGEPGIGLLWQRHSFTDIHLLRRSKSKQYTYVPLCVERG